MGFLSSFYWVILLLILWKSLFDFEIALLIIVKWKERVLTLCNLFCHVFPFQPTLCEGPIDSWLSALITGLKQTLVGQLASVMNPAQPEGDPTSQGEGVAAPEEPPRTAGSMGRVEKSFTLDNCSEVVLLATQIELCKKIEKSLKQV